MAFNEARHPNFIASLEGHAIFEPPLRQDDHRPGGKKKKKKERVVEEEDEYDASFVSLASSSSSTLRRPPPSSSSSFTSSSKRCHGNRIVVRNSALDTDAVMLVLCDRTIRLTSLTDLKLGGKSAMKIVKTPPLPAPSHSLALSSAAGFLCVYSDNECIILKCPTQGLSCYTRENSPKCRLELVGNLTDFTQLAWHPLSDRHLLVLYTGTTHILDVIESTKYPEQSFDTRSARSFCFGPQIGWDRFSIYTTDKEGDVSVFCPVVPNGCVIEQSILTELKCDVFDDAHSLSDYETHLQGQMADDWLADCWRDVQLDLDKSVVQDLLFSMYTIPYKDDNLPSFPPVDECLLDTKPSEGKPISNFVPQVEAQTISSLNNNNGSLVMLFMTWNCGTVDILGRFERTSPKWKIGREMKGDDELKREHDALSPPLILLLDRVDISRGEVLCTSFYSTPTTPLYCQFAEGVCCISMSWLEELQKALSDKFEIAAAQMSKELDCVRVDIWESKGSVPIGMGILSDLACGDYVIILDNEFQCHAFTANTFRVKIGPQLEDKRRQMDTFGIAPFSELSRNFMTLANDILENPKTCIQGGLGSLPKGMAGLRPDELYEEEHIKYFVDLHRRYSQFDFEARSIRHLMMTRISLLKQYNEIQCGVFDALASQIAGVDEANRKLSAEAKYQLELQGLILEYAQSVYRKVAASTQRTERFDLDGELTQNENRILHNALKEREGEVHGNLATAQESQDKINRSLRRLYVGKNNRKPSYPNVEQASKLYKRIEGSALAIRDVSKEFKDVKRRLKKLKISQGKKGKKQSEPQEPLRSELRDDVLEEEKGGVIDV